MQVLLDDQNLLQLKQSPGPAPTQESEPAATQGPGPAPTSRPQPAPTNGLSPAPTEKPELVPKPKQGGIW